MAIRLQCSACNKTLQVADTAAGKKARCPSCQTLNDVPAASNPPSTGSVAPAPKPTAGVPKPATPSAAAKSSSGAANASGNPETMLVACSNCGKASRVMKSSAGKTVQCPHCKGKITVPGGKPAAKPPVPTAKPVAPAPKPASAGSTDIFGSVPSSSSSSSSGDIFGSVPSTPSYDVFGGGQQSNNTLWNDLGDQAGGGGGGGGGWQPMGAAPANPYSSPGYGGGYSGGGGYSAPRRTERSIAVYIISGVLIALWGFLLVISACVRLGVIVIAITNLPPNQTVRWEVLIGYTIGALIGLAMGGIQLFGGISLAMRNNLSMARTGAIVCTIPCFGVFCFPVGIWATVLLFSGSYRRDFGESDY